MHEDFNEGQIRAENDGGHCTAGTGMSGCAAGDCAESIADAIKQAFDTKDKWAELGIAARAFIEEHYEWSKIGKQSVRRYEGLINE